MQLLKSEEETLRILREANRIAGLHVVEPNESDEWPAPMEPDAFIGIAGDFTRLVGPHTEADPGALLGNFLVAAGVLFGRERWAVADGRRHYPIEFLLVTGQTGSGRKGTSTERTLPVMERVEEGFRQHVLGGLSSGEGLIKGVSPEEGEFALPGQVRRYLALLSEFATLLTVMRREGNTLSSILREAWDGTRLRVLTRKEPLDVNNVNLSVVAHITKDELLSSLTATDRCNGFGNRFLIVMSRRSKFLPEGGTDVNLNSIVDRLHSAVQSAKGRGQIDRDAAARELWASEYPTLTRERYGIRGAMCGRAEAHVLRLSVLYALLDSAAAIRVEHLRAALAFWGFCERCINHIFGASSGDPQAEKILRSMASGPMSVSELHRLFNNNKQTDWIEAKMATLVRAGKVVQTTKQGDRKVAVKAWDIATKRGHNVP